MSYGYGVSDFTTVGRLAWKVYKSCKDAPESFQNISSEVLLLHVVLKEAEDLFTGHELPESVQARLKVVSDGCQGLLADLQGLVERYEGLGTQGRRTWDRLKWGSNDLGELRLRLISNTAMLTAFMSTSQVVIGKKLDKFVREFQEEKREGSVLSAQTVESLSTDEQDMWRTIKKELEEIGITVAAFDSNKGFILDWLRTAVANGAFDEQEGYEHSSDGMEGYRSIVAPLEWLKEERIAAEQPPMLASPIMPTMEMTASGTGNGESLEKTVAAEQPPVPAAPRIPTTETTESSTGEGRSPPTGMDLTKLGQQKSRRGERSLNRRRLPVLVIWALRYNRAVCTAVKQGNIEKVKQLVSRGADVNTRDSFNSTLLAIAAHQGHEAIVRCFLDNGADVNAKNNSGNTPLAGAAGKGHEAIVRCLLDNGADVNAKSNAGNTPLVKAADRGHEAIVRCLLGNGADINAKSNNGFTPLANAAHQGHETIVRVLLDNGADVDAKNNTSNNPLSLAAYRGHEKMVRYLVGCRADIGWKDTGGYTPLAIAAYCGHEKIVRFLLDNGADISSRNKWGGTPLHIAASTGHEHVIRTLLSSRYGIDMTARDEKGQTALDEAKRAGHYRILSLLLIHLENMPNAKGLDTTTGQNVSARGWLVNRRLRPVRGQQTQRQNYATNSRLS